MQLLIGMPEWRMRGMANAIFRTLTAMANVEVRNGASIQGGRFLLISPTPMVRFLCGFR